MVAVPNSDLGDLERRLFKHNAQSQLILGPHIQNSYFLVSIVQV